MSPLRDIVSEYEAKIAEDCTEILDVKKSFSPKWFKIRARAIIALALYNLLV